jgi:hypothetical protein
MTLKLGCIADDFTGATDLANNLVRAGMRVVQTIGVPEGPVAGVDAVVVALKSRTNPAAEAVAMSLAAARWLRAQGAAQLYFKVCSTFDSTAAGNIGPVAEALLAETGSHFAIVTPAFPENGRTVFKGHLFVGELLLSDSPMRQHPLTPMTDANLVRVLQAQVQQARVGLVDHRAQATRRRPPTRRWRHSKVNVLRSIRCAWPPAKTSSLKPWPGRGRGWTRPRCSSTPRRSRLRCRRCSSAWARRRPARWSKARWRPLPMAWCRWVSASSWWRAAKPPAPACSAWA